jgi:hypothetical protein
MAHYLTNSMEQIPSWKDKSPSARQDSARSLRKTQVHYRAHSRLSLVPTSARRIQSTPSPAPRKYA